MPAPAHRSGLAASPPSAPLSCAWFGRTRLELRRVHDELTTLGIKVEPSTVWEILKQEGLAPTPERASTTWADFLRSQADALLAADSIETIPLNGQCQYILAVIEHTTRRVRVLGTTAHPSANWVTQAMKNLVAPRPGWEVPGPHGQAPRRAGIKTVLTGIRFDWCR